MIEIRLTSGEAEWLIKLITVSRELGRMWDMRLDDDLGNAVAVKVAQAGLEAGMTATDYMVQARWRARPRQ